MVSLSNIEIFLRLLTALLCGAVIGLNRDLHHKPAGFRTFGLVGVGSAVVVLVVLQTSPGSTEALSRVMQGILTGIGFLGAGVILHRPANFKVSGLTTAAAVWLTAGLGIAAGAGMWVIALFGLALAIILLVVGGPAEKLIERVFKRPALIDKDDQ